MTAIGIMRSSMPCICPQRVTFIEGFPLLWLTHMYSYRLYVEVTRSLQPDGLEMCKTEAYVFTFRLHENGESTTSETQMKCCANAENVFYQVWSTRKVGVDSENHWKAMVEKKLVVEKKLKIVQPRHCSTQTRCLSPSLVASCLIDPHVLTYM